MTATSIKDVLKSPTLFVMKILGMKPLRYQAEFLEDNSPKIIVVGGRQIGKSTMLSWKAIWKAFTHPNEEILIISASFEQAQLVYSKIYETCRNNEFLSTHLQKITLHETRFDNGSGIRCLTAGRKGTFGRGYSATMVMFDEASIIPEEAFVSLEPALAVRGSQLIMSGTPMGKRGRFYKVWESHFHSREWSAYQIKSSENPFVSRDYLREEAQIMTAEQYAQEHEAVFLDTVGRFYPLDLVMDAADDYKYSLERKKPDGSFYMGIDVAHMGTDETAIVVIFVPKDDKHLRTEVSYAKTLLKSDILSSSKEIIDTARAMDCELIMIDKIGLGAGMYDILRATFGNKVRGVVLEGKRRESAYNYLKIMLENHKLRLNINDTKLLYQFGSYTMKESVSGSLRITKDTSSHDDLVDALVLATTALGATLNYVPFEGLGELFTLEEQYIQNMLKRGFPKYLPRT